MSAVVRIWIQRVLYESTASSDVSAEDQNRLLKYLDETTTRDLTYKELVNRALDDKTKDPRVQQKVVSLLKRYLFRFPPSSETLLYLDHFASSVGDGSSAQSLAFVRSLVQTQLRRGGSSVAPTAARDSTRNSRTGSFASFDAPLQLLGNFWALGRTDVALPEIPVAGGAKSFFDWQVGDDAASHNALGIDVFAAPTCDRIAIVAEFKMQSGLKGARDHTQKKRPAPKAVVFDQQKPVHLSDEEFRKLLSVVINEDACGRERHMMASKVLLKVLMDGFVLLSPAAAAKKTLQAMLKIVSKDDSRARLHALNLLMNLAVEANLATTSTIFQARATKGHAGSGARGTTRSPTALAEDLAASAASSAKVAAVVDAVWMTTCEVLLRLASSPEDSSVTWGAALNLVLLQTTEQGKVNFQKLSMLDLRVLSKILLNVAALGDDTQRIALAILCNCMLELSPDRKSATLPPERFALAKWPIYQVVELYVSARSAETVSNSFLIVFHHVIGKLRDAAPPTSLQRFNEQTTTLMAVLSSMGAPYLFQKVFLHPLTQEEVRSLSGVISAVKSQSKGKGGVTLRQTKAKRQNNKLLGQLDVQFVSDFFGALLKEGTDYLGLDPELEAYKELMLTHPKSMRPLLDTLDELLFSSWQLDRHYGLNWLFDLMVVLIENDPEHTAAAASSGGSPRTPATPVHFGAGRGASKGRGRPLSSLRVGGAAPVPSGGPAGVQGAVSPRGPLTKGVSPTTGGVAPGQLPKPTVAPSQTPVKDVARPVSVPPIKSPRGPGIAFDRAAVANSDDSSSTTQSPRLPQLQLPEASPLRLKLAGNTPEEVSLSFQKMRTLINDTHDKLLSSPSAAIRSGYALLMKRLLSYVRSRFANNPDHAVTFSASLINKMGANLISRRESDPLMLMQLFDLIFDFVASDNVSGSLLSSTSGNTGTASPAAQAAAAQAASPVSTLLTAEACKDTNYMQFLSGARRVSMPLLLMVDAANLKLLFDHLPPSFENVRVTILIWIAAICNDKTDEERAKAAFSLVGQLAWFKNLLDDPNPLIAYHSSRFLSEYLQGQDPVQYSLALKKLIAIIPEDKIAIDFFHVLALLGDSTYLTIGRRKGSDKP